EAGTGEDAQAVETLEADLDGDDIQIAFNSGFLLDGLGAIGGDLARLNFTTSTKPAILTGKPTEESTTPESRYLIMPARVSGVSRSTGPIDVPPRMGGGPGGPDDADMSTAGDETGEPCNSE